MGQSIKRTINELKILAPGVGATKYEDIWKWGSVHTLDQEQINQLKESLSNGGTKELSKEDAAGLLIASIDPNKELSTQAKDALEYWAHSPAQNKRLTLEEAAATVIELFPRSNKEVQDYVAGLTPYLDPGNDSERLAESYIANDERVISGLRDDIVLQTLKWGILGATIITGISVGLFGLYIGGMTFLSVIGACIEAFLLTIIFYAAYDHELRSQVKKAYLRGELKSANWRVNPTDPTITKLLNSFVAGGILSFIFLFYAWPISVLSAALFYYVIPIIYKWYPYIENPYQARRETITVPGLDTEAVAQTAPKKQLIDGSKLEVIRLDAINPAKVAMPVEAAVVWNMHNWSMDNLGPTAWKYVHENSLKHEEFSNFEGKVYESLNNGREIGLTYAVEAYIGGLHGAMIGLTKKGDSEIWHEDITCGEVRRIITQGFVQAFITGLGKNHSEYLGCLRSPYLLKAVTDPVFIERIQNLGLKNESISQFFRLLYETDEGGVLLSPQFLSFLEKLGADKRAAYIKSIYETVTFDSDTGKMHVTQHRHEPLYALTDARIFDLVEKFNSPAFPASAYFKAVGETANPRELSSKKIIGLIDELGRDRAAAYLESLIGEAKAGYKWERAGATFKSKVYPVIKENKKLTRAVELLTSDKVLAQSGKMKGFSQKLLGKYLIALTKANKIDYLLRADVIESILAIDEKRAESYLSLSKEISASPNLGPLTATETIKSLTSLNVEEVTEYLNYLGSVKKGESVSIQEWREWKDKPILDRFFGTKPGRGGVSQISDSAQPTTVKDTTSPESKQTPAHITLSAARDLAKRNVEKMRGLEYSHLSSLERLLRESENAELADKVRDSRANLIENGGYTTSAKHEGRWLIMPRKQFNGLMLGLVPTKLEDPGATTDIRRIIEEKIKEKNDWVKQQLGGEWAKDSDKRFSIGASSLSALLDMISDEQINEIEDKIKTITERNQAGFDVIHKAFLVKYKRTFNPAEPVGEVAWSIDSGEPCAIHYNNDMNTGVQYGRSAQLTKQAIEALTKRGVSLNPRQERAALALLNLYGNLYHEEIEPHGRARSNYYTTAGSQRVSKYCELGEGVAIHYSAKMIEEEYDLPYEHLINLIHIQEYFGFDPAGPEYAGQLAAVKALDLNKRVGAERLLSELLTWGVETWKVDEESFKPYALDQLKADAEALDKLIKEKGESLYQSQDDFPTEAALKAITTNKLFGKETDPAKKELAKKSEEFLIRLYEAFDMKVFECGLLERALRFHEKVMPG